MAATEEEDDLELEGEPSDLDADLDDEGGRENSNDA